MKTNGTVDNQCQLGLNKFWCPADWPVLKKAERPFPIGRFLGVDPMASAGGQDMLSPYQAMGNDPVSETDPGGLQPLMRPRPTIPDVTPFGHEIVSWNNPSYGGFTSEAIADMSPGFTPDTDPMNIEGLMSGGGSKDSKKTYSSGSLSIMAMIYVAYQNPNKTVYFNNGHFDGVSGFTMLPTVYVYASGPDWSRWDADLYSEFGSNTLEYRYFRQVMFKGASMAFDLIKDNYYYGNSKTDWSGVIDASIGIVAGTGEWVAGGVGEWFSAGTATPLTIPLFVDGGIRMGTNATRLGGYFTGHNGFAKAMPTSAGAIIGKGMDMTIGGKSFYDNGLGQKLGGTVNDFGSFIFTGGSGDALGNILERQEIFKNSFIYISSTPTYIWGQISNYKN